MDEEQVERLRQLGYVGQDAPQGGVVAPAAPPAQAPVTAATPGARPGAKPAPPVAKAEARPDEMVVVEAAAPEVLSSSAAVSSLGYDVLKQDPKAVVQTGPGLPSWSWRRYTLQWTGPVGADHHMRLFLASPGVNRLLTLIRLVLAGLLAAVLLNGGRLPRLPFAAPPVPPEPAVTVALLALLLWPLPAAAAGQAADTPSPALLQDLKRRLTRPEACGQSCVDTPRLLIQVTGEELRLVAEVHAQADGTWRVPGPLGSWVPASVSVDGAPAAVLAQQSDAFLYVRLSRGVHRVEARGPVPPGDTFTLELADRPRQARAEATGWEVSGLRRDSPPDPSLQLSRRLPSGRRETEGAGAYAPWLQVTRTVSLGIAWRVHTEVLRMSPPGAPLALRVPLLPGESPTDSTLTVEAGSVAVSLGRDQMMASWSSTLEAGEGLTLTAPKDRPWSEVWRVQCGLAWSCTLEGPAPVSREAESTLEPRYRPWPGDTLSVRVRRPAAIEGQTVTLDKVELHAVPGSRTERVSLRLQARSSREQALVLGLPEAAELQELTVDGESRSLRPEKGRLSVTVPAGAHTLALRWQQERGLGLAYALPVVSLNAPAANLSLSLDLPQERWLLFTWGPAWGPAVLFWPYLVFLLVSAWVLGRLPGSPLTSVQWVLLGLGLSQIPALGALFVAAFFFAVAFRKNRPFEGALAFNLGQVALVLGALVTVVLLYDAVQTGLLFRPDMQVGGQGSSDTALRWYADRVSEATPRAGVVSLPLWVYRVLMLVWALWLATRLVGWAGWAWRAFADGSAWRPLPAPKLKRKREEPGAAPPPPAEGPVAPEGGPRT